MNITHLEHVLYALAMQAAFILALRRRAPGHWLGATFAIGWFFSREHTQREYKLFVFGQSREHIRPWDGLLGWSFDKWADALCPTLAVIAVALWIDWRRRQRMRR
ncbi:hypothetical protein V8Z80_01295 [Orrella sp. JC864]|uniref:hypothetical protein n=1 Tax=Orrella sp. JC864 TaxID=3120298 RepID=UPI0012BC644B